MNNDLVSVIIPCFNAEKYLRETVESVFAQTYKNYEVILVDDGSTDGTPSIIHSYSDKAEIKFCSHVGASAIRNIGTGLAKGKFFQYLDSDDILTNDSIERKVNVLVENNGDVAYSDWQKLEEQHDGSFRLGDITSRLVEDIHPNIEIAMFTDFWAPPAALLYRKEIVNKIGSWNESLLIIQDARFLLDAAINHGKFVYTKSVGAYYRVHEKNSLSRKNSKAFIKDCFLNAMQIHKLWQKQNKINDEYKKALLKAFGHVARASFENDKETFEAAYNILKTIEPNYIPDGPILLSIVSRMVGYERAEVVALFYRKIKNYIKLITKKNIA